MHTVFAILISIIKLTEGKQTLTDLTFVKFYCPLCVSIIELQVKLTTKSVPERKQL